MQIADHVLVFDARGTPEKSDIEHLDPADQEKLSRYERIGLVEPVTSPREAGFCVRF